MLDEINEQDTDPDKVNIREERFSNIGFEDGQKTKGANVGPLAPADVS